MLGSGECMFVSVSDVVCMEGCFVMFEGREQGYLGEDDSQFEEGLGCMDVMLNFDIEVLFDLLFVQVQSGVFEVMLFGGEMLVVLIDLRELLVLFLLVVGSDWLCQILFGKRLELEKGLV